MLGFTRKPRLSDLFPMGIGVTPVVTNEEGVNRMNLVNYLQQDLRMNVTERVLCHPV